jgi:4-hydroxybenzoate polyprenyltransferase
VDVVRLKAHLDLSASEAPDNVNVKEQKKILKLKLANTIIHTNISLAVAAVLLTVSAQIQLGLKPQWQPFLFLIFSGTLFEYNRHRIVILFFQGGMLNSGKHELFRRNQKIFFLTALILGIAFVAAALSTKTGVLLTFLLLGFLTLSYSGLGFENKKHHYKLREIPYLKIFLITSIWSVSTILLPVIQAGNEIFNSRVILLFAERFFFIFAIAIQFDIRDMQADQRAGLKTIPLLIGQDKAIILSFLTLAASLFFSVFHYPNQNDWFILWALCISTAITYLFLKIHFFKNLTRYYYQVLDGALLLQGILVLGFYFLNQH